MDNLEPIADHIDRVLPKIREIRHAIHQNPELALQEFDTGILDAELCQRVAYIDAMKYGVSVMQYAPSSKAAAEIERLCDELFFSQKVEEDRHDAPVNPIEALYKEETENILFRSFQGI